VAATLILALFVLVEGRIAAPASIPAVTSSRPERAM